MHLIHDYLMTNEILDEQKNIGYRLKAQPIYRYSDLPISDNRYFFDPSFYRYR